MGKTHTLFCIKASGLLPGVILWQETNVSGLISVPEEGTLSCAFLWYLHG
jgi:hypothetical protein